LQAAKYIFAWTLKPAFQSLFLCFFMIKVGLNFILLPNAIEISTDMRIELIVIDQEGIVSHQ